MRNILSMLFIKHVLIMIFVIVVHFNSYAISDNNSASSNNAESQQPNLQPEWYTLKKFSAQEKLNTCKTYEGKYISYYDSVYFVEKCKRRKVVIDEMLQRITKNKTPIYTVDSNVIAMLDEGEELHIAKNTVYKKRSCKDFDNSYITEDYINIYFVKNCYKHYIPDWETYVWHRKKYNISKSEILILSFSEFKQIKEGKPIASVLDNEYEKLLSGQKNIEVLPIHKACAGLEGKDVSFLDKIYKIEKCKKRPYDAVEYLKKHKNQKLNLIELSSEQWLSLPEGKPIDIK